MGPPENLTDHPENQAGRRKRSARRLRERHCLLKGCNQSFHPRQSNQRYCSAECRKAARKWSRWKAQQRYRATKSGKAKRTDQSRRYRERVKSRKPAAPEADNETARVISPEDFFRSFLRPAGLLRGIRTPAAKSLATLLLARLPARDGARPRKRAPLEAGEDLKP
jgi:septal ring factor EnvC (AmiA/AmiB activator)